MDLSVNTGALCEGIAAVAARPLPAMAMPSPSKMSEQELELRVSAALLVRSPGRRLRCTARAAAPHKSR